MQMPKISRMGPASIIVNGYIVTLDRGNISNNILLNIDTGEISRFNEFDGKLMKYNDPKWALGLLKTCEQLMGDTNERVKNGEIVYTSEEKAAINGAIVKFQKIVDAQENANKTPKGKITN